MEKSKDDLTEDFNYEIGDDKKRKLLFSELLPTSPQSIIPSKIPRLATSNLSRNDNFSFSKSFPSSELLSHKNNCFQKIPPSPLKVLAHKNSESIEDEDPFKLNVENSLQSNIDVNNILDKLSLKDQGASVSTEKVSETFKFNTTNNTISSESSLNSRLKAPKVFTSKSVKSTKPLSTLHA